MKLNRPLLNDLLQIIHRLILGEGISWLRTNRLRRLMEDETYRRMTLQLLRKGTSQTRVLSDHVPDIVSLIN